MGNITIPAEPPIQKVNIDNFHSICDELISRDQDLHAIVEQFGYPPLWNRSNTFESLVHIILEQQVSLASALAALNKLREKIIAISPQNFLTLNDEQLRACYFSRQKTMYVRGLAEAIVDNRLNLDELAIQSDNEVRSQLTNFKGIGRWTADIYLIFVLQRADIFPAGDLAAVNALKQVKGIYKSGNEFDAVIQQWAPYRTVATMMLWHYYLSIRNKKV